MNLLGALEATWPAARTFDRGPFTLREGLGGGKRVSAAGLNASELPSPDALQDAEHTMADLGQTPLFSLTQDQPAFDEQLSNRGYERVDPTRIYHQPVATLVQSDVPPVTAFAIWEPLAIMEDIWFEGGIGPDRIAVMLRASGPKTGILGRIDNRPAGAAFIGCFDDIAMLHALEVKAQFRRRGLARHMMTAAAHWAHAQQCTTLALLVTEANEPANALYRSMGFEGAPAYHYRILRT